MNENKCFVEFDDVTDVPLLCRFEKVEHGIPAPDTRNTYLFLFNPDPLNAHTHTLSFLVKTSRFFREVPEVFQLFLNLVERGDVRVDLQGEIRDVNFVLCTCDNNNQVITELRFDRTDHLVYTSPECRFFERGYHAAGTEPAQVTALRSRGVFGILPGHFREISFP